MVDIYTETFVPRILGFTNHDAQLSGTLLIRTNERGFMKGMTLKLSNTGTDAVIIQTAKDRLSSPHLAIIIRLENGLDPLVLRRTQTPGRWSPGGYIFAYFKLGAGDVDTISLNLNQIIKPGTIKSATNASVVVGFKVWQKRSRQAVMNFAAKKVNLHNFKTCHFSLHDARVWLEPSNPIGECRIEPDSRHLHKIKDSEMLAFPSTQSSLELTNHLSKTYPRS